MQTRGKILVIRGGAIGDFILTLPAIAALRRQFPDAHLEVLGYPHIVQLAVAGRLVDKVQSIEAGPLAGFFARNGTLNSELVEYFSSFNLIISYLFDPDEIFKTNVARCTKAQFIVGPHRPKETDTIHATQTFLKPLERLAIFDADPFPHLSINSQPSTLNLIALHPGSGSEKKNWSEAKWADLLQHLLTTTIADLLLVGGEAEGERLQRLAAALPPTRVRVAQSLSLVELAQLLQHCTTFVGHDSGISHLAAALGIPAVILWGDTIEQIWRPPHERVVIVKAVGGLPSITVSQVAETLRSLLTR
ncbi:MAG TPA: glycosyltransferase family 9 protein [Verrucomicrobiae bacterium]|nr:glycosyltransferase family 9 protein [Verrucomicrobiae bacterium]